MKYQSKVWGKFVAYGDRETVEAAALREIAEYAKSGIDGVEVEIAYCGFRAVVIETYRMVDGKKVDHVINRNI